MKEYWDVDDMKIYDFDIEDEMQKIEMTLQNVEAIRNSLADHTAKFRRFSQRINLDFRVLSDCIEAYERTLLIGVYTYAEQLAKNFYYELLEKDRTQRIYTNNFINKKLDVEKFSPNVMYSILEKSIRDELFPEFRFIIKKDREEITKYDDIIKDRHRYAHRGIYQSNCEPYRDVINAEKFITIELAMIVTNGMMYRIQYQDDWKDIGALLNSSYVLYKQFEVNHHKELKRQLVQKAKMLRNKCRTFYNKYSVYIDNCFLLEGVKNQLLRVNTMNLRMISSFSIIEDFIVEVKNSKMIIV